MTSNAMASLYLILQVAIMPVFVIVLIVFLERALRQLLPLIAGDDREGTHHD